MGTGGTLGELQGLGAGLGDDESEGQSGVGVDGGGEV